MKRKYVKPAMRIVRLQPCRMLAQSGGPNYTPTPGGPGQF